ARTPRCRLWGLRSQAAFVVEQRGKLVHVADDRLGARQAGRLLSLQLSLRERLRRTPGCGLHGAVSLYRWTPSPGDAADRIDRRPPRTAPRGPKRLHAQTPRAAVAEGVAQLFGSSPW